MLSGVGALGRAALELLARSNAVARVVTVKRSPWDGENQPALALIGAIFQGHAVGWSHYQADLANTEQMAQVLEQVRPDVVIHSATVQSPRHLMRAHIDPAVKARLKRARFGLWLPWHLVPATQLMRAVAQSGVETQIVNAAFPDAVNHVLANRFGAGPVAGAGNVEVCAAQITRFLTAETGADLSEVDVKLVGSHALLSYGPEVPHHLEMRVRGEDVTEQYAIETMLASPQEIDWTRVNDFFIFAASAVKNALALLQDEVIHTHVSGANGLPGGYPVTIGSGKIDLDLPRRLDRDQAIAINQAGMRWDGIERFEPDGGVVYTQEAQEAMSELGIDAGPVRFEEMEERSKMLSAAYDKMTSTEVSDA